MGCKPFGLYPEVTQGKEEAVGGHELCGTLTWIVFRLLSLVGGDGEEAGGETAEVSSTPGL